MYCLHVLQDVSQVSHSVTSSVRSSGGSEAAKVGILIGASMIMRLPGGFDVG